MITEKDKFIISQFSDLSHLSYVSYLYPETPHNEYPRDQRSHIRIFYRVFTATDAGLDTICTVADSIYLL